MVSKIKNMVLGAFLLIGTAAVVAILLFIKPHVGDEMQMLCVRFASVTGISKGTRVSLAGKAIGVVYEITPIDQAREHQAVTQSGAVYFYMVQLRIDSGVTIYTTDSIVVESKGLLGEKSINIIPRPLTALSKAYTSMDVACADSTEGLEDTFREVTALSAKARETLALVKRWLELYGGELGDTVASVNETVKEAHKTLSDVNESEIVADVKTSTQAAANMLSKLDTAIQNFNVQAFLQHFMSTMRNTNIITSLIASGKGSLGKLVVDDGLYLNLDAVMGKTNVLLNDINQYGLLFQYNKEWQRLRAQRMACVQTFKDPKAFSMQMNRELDTLVTVLERIEATTDLQDEDTQECVIQDPCFQRAFRDFMQRLETIRSQVQLYNQKLYDIQRESCHEPYSSE